MSGLEGVLSFNFSGSMGRTNFVVDPPLHVDGNRVTIDTSGLVSEVVGGTNITVDNTDPTHPIVSATGSSAVVESVVAGSNVTVDATDPANPIVSASGVVESVVAGTNVTVDNTDPANPIVSASGGSGVVESIVAGTNVTVDDTDPANPIVSLDDTAVGAVKVLTFDIAYTSFNLANFTLFTPTGGDIYHVLSMAIDGALSTNFTGGGDGQFYYDWGTMTGSSEQTNSASLSSTQLAAIASKGKRTIQYDQNHAGATVTNALPVYIQTFKSANYSAGSLHLVMTMIKVA